jgi:general secretion pathway protein J
VKRQRGFTLLELVIAMTLTAMLLGMLSAGMYSVVNDWERENSGLDATLDKALVVLQLDRALQSAFPHSYIDTELVSQYIYFEGTEHSVSFVSTVSPQRQPGLMTWSLDSGKDGVTLRLTPAFGDDPRPRLAELDAIDVLPNYSAEIRYLVQRDVDSKEWLEEWKGSERQSLPLAVHVVLTPIDEELNDEVLEIVAPIRAWRSPDIEPIVVAGP